MDCSQAGLANIELESVRLLLRLMMDYFPACLAKVICYDVHWLIRPVMKLALKLIPSSVNKEILVVSGAEQLHEHIAPDQLPPVMGGPREDQPFGRAVDGAVSMYDEAPARFGVSTDQIRELIDHVNKQRKKHRGE